jgi:hypothetical protein
VGEACSTHGRDKKCIVATGLTMKTAAFEGKLLNVILKLGSSVMKLRQLGVLLSYSVPCIGPCVFCIA